LGDLLYGKIKNVPANTLNLGEKDIMGLRRFWLGKGKSSISLEKRLSKDAVVTLVIHAFYHFGASMAGVFLNLYLWRLTESLFINGLFLVVSFSASSIAFAIGGKIAKTMDRLFVYRMGILLTAVFYLMVIIIRDSVVEYFYLFAIFNGTAGAFYWLGYLTLMYDVSTDRNRIRYLGLNSITFNAAGLAGPALAGFIIAFYQDLSGYIIVFSLAFVMFIITTVGSLRLRSDATHHKTYYLKMMGLLMRKNRLFLKGLIGWLVVGLMQGTILFLPNILLYTVLGREDLIGYMGVLFLGLTIATSYVLSRYAQEHQAKMFILIAACGYVVAAFFLLWDISTITVICFIAIFFVCAPLQFNSFSAYHYRIVGKLPLKGHLRVETMVGREIFINIGRVISILLIIFLSEGITGEWLPWIVFFAAVTQFSFYWLIHKEEADRDPLQHS
jgi:YQGE family putative transporter